MNCDTVESLLLDLVEGDLDERQARLIQAHIEECANCWRALSETRELLGVIAEAKREQTHARQTHQPDRIPSTRAGGFFGWRVGDLLGDFEIQGEIGRGGMGVVYRARQVSLNRIVALKILPASLGATAKAISRFKKEAQAAARLHHTNIVPVYAQGEYEGHFYYAMELIDGQSLDRILHEDPSRIVPTPAETPVPGESTKQASPPGDLSMTGSGARRAGYQRLALLIAAVAEGLEHAHSQGVIHRDVKPQNLLLGADGQLHITDFGLARLLNEPSLTISGEMLGTPAYMSPEQVTADRGKIDHRTDIYSLGVTLYELLTRRRPFDGATREQITARIRTDDPRPPRKLNHAIPIDLETICLRAMEKDPRRRYQKAGELAADLRRYAEDRPIISRRVGPLERAVKWVRRHPARTAILGLSLAIAIGAPVWTIQYSKARHARADELVRRAFELLAYDDYRDTAQAADFLEAAQALGPANEVLYRETIALTSLLERPELAIENLRRALIIQPENRELMYLLAWALRRNEEAQESKDWLRKAAELGGADTAAGDFFHAQAVVRTSPDEAVAAYRDAIHKKKNYAQACIHLGRAHNHWMYHHRNQERFVEQQTYLTMACDMQPGKAYPRYLLSIAHRLSAEIYEADRNHEYAEMRYAEALSLAHEAQAREPDSPLGYACEAEYWEARKVYSRAIACRDQEEKACKTRGQLADMYLYRWRLHYWTGQLHQALDDVIQLNNHISDTDPKKIWCIGLFPALISAEQGDADRARIAAWSMAERNPADFRAVASAAAMLRVLGADGEAERLLTERASLVGHVSDVQHSSPEGWNQAVYDFCRGLASLPDLEARAADLPSNKLLWSAPSFFAATAALGRGERTAALTYFRRCEQTYDYDDWCYLGRLCVRKLEADPNWPSWLPSGAMGPSPKPLSP